jgi:hypothetical protein
MQTRSTPPSYPHRTSGAAILVVLALLAREAGSQTPIPKTTLPDANITQPPAPPVTSWTPQTRVVSGMPITITGTFDPATIQVRLAGHKLVLLARSTTTVIAKAPNGDDAVWQLANFRAGTPLTVQTGFSLARTLDADYEVLDRWSDFQPRLVSMTTSQHAAGLLGDSLRSVGFLGNVTLAGLPGNAFDSLRAGPVTASACGQEVITTQRPGPATYTASSSGGTLGLTVRFHFDPVRIGPCQLFLPLALHYQDNPSDVRVVMVNLGTHAISNPSNIITVTSTFDMVSGGFLEFDDVTASNWGVCSGSAFPGGPAVGRINVAGDVAFKVLTGPAGTTCVWNFKTPRFNSGWRVRRYVFTETETGSKCGVSRGGAPQDGRISSFAFNRLTKFAGWETVDGNTLFGPSGDRVQIFLTCALDVNPTSASALSRLERVELVAPAGETDWRRAFFR